MNKTANKLGFSSVKPQQMIAINEFINGKDVFVALPTGFGKTMCFTCLTMVFDELCPDSKPSVVLVVTPLVAIMQDQVYYYTGIKCNVAICKLLQIKYTLIQYSTVSTGI